MLTKFTLLYRIAIYISQAEKILMSPETRFRIESRTKRIDLHYSTASSMSNVKLKFNCAH